MDAVIEEARATIEDALEAAELAKEQARAAEIALRDRMGVLDELARSEGKVIKYQEMVDGLESKLYRGQLETKQLQVEVKVRGSDITRCISSVLACCVCFCHEKFCALYISARKGKEHHACILLVRLCCDSGKQSHF